ncbi:hypothetical protein GDO78_016153 [Eleutherodactylus coqui]|uniref:Uncharacterized protein n=1 Tax=Eleutherodactylus coqui TaxID=57060 RepID=A0A8J6E663_ELECQ|nr:hypothetical protein GDO78_016153 [Eleutherodactylus coqui]
MARQSVPTTGRPLGEQLSHGQTFSAHHRAPTGGAAPTWPNIQCPPQGAHWGSSSHMARQSVPTTGRPLGEQLPHGQTISAHHRAPTGGAATTWPDNQCPPQGTHWGSSYHMARQSVPTTGRPLGEQLSHDQTISAHHRAPTGGAAPTWPNIQCPPQGAHWGSSSHMARQSVPTTGRPLGKQLSHGRAFTTAEEKTEVVAAATRLPTVDNEGRWRSSRLVPLSLAGSSVVSRGTDQTADLPSKVHNINDP